MNAIPSNVQIASPTPKQFVAVGLDLGRSAIKIATNHGHVIMPTAACPAMSISDGGEAKRAAADTFVGGDGHEYFVGDTALVQGSAHASIGITDRWVQSPEYVALMRGAYAKAIQGAPDDDPELVVMGLPASLCASQAGELTRLGKDILGVEVCVLPQSHAAYMSYKLGRDGVPKMNLLDKTNYGVIEVGYYTTDYSLILKDRPTERANVSCSGARIAVENLQRLLRDEGIKASLQVCDEALQTGSLSYFGDHKDLTEEIAEAVAPLVAEIIDTANSVLEDVASTCHGILIAGGGAPIISKQIKSKWRNAIVVKNPRYAVAEGMRRFGELVMTSNRIVKGA